MVTTFEDENNFFITDEEMDNDNNELGEDSEDEENDFEMDNYG